jgi:hypothetical protein
MSRNRARWAACGVLMASGFAVSGCGGSSYDESDYSDDRDTSYTDSNTFPEDMSDPDYSGNNGSDAESFCSDINTPDMDACQRGYNNLDDALNGG